MDVGAGGAKRAEDACEEALNAVFNLQVEHHQYIQAYTKDGKVKWALLEMWPLQVNIT